MQTDGWIPVAELPDLPEGKAVKVEASGEDVLLCRVEDRIFAVSNRCTHQGAPLHRGILKAREPQPNVTCPAHGSVFSLEDGRVRRGPAMQPITVFETQVNGERVEIRPRP